MSEYKLHYETDPLKMPLLYVPEDTFSEIYDSAMKNYRAEIRAKTIDEIVNNINKVLEEPQYQHENEDWRIGLILAQNIAEELKEQSE